MFTKFVGHYSLKDIVAYLFHGNNSLDFIRHHLPQKPIYFYNSGRAALYDILLQRKQKSTKKHIIIPGYGCPIVLAVTHYAGFTPLVLDVSPHSLKMDVNEIIENSRKHDVDSVILIAENGILYEESELQQLKKEGLFLIADHCLSWQNLDRINTNLTDAEIFSGGFNKPISGLGFGAMTTNEEMEKFHSKKSIYLLKLLKTMAFIVIQNPAIYPLFKSEMKKDPDSVFDGKIGLLSLNSAAIVKNSLIKSEQYKQHWLDLQSQLKSIFEKREISSLVVSFPNYLQGRVLFQKKILKAKNYYGIHYHQQYKYDILSDERTKTIESDYEGIQRLKSDYLAMSLNKNSIENKEKFIEAFQRDIS